jgi:hypothetical protein
MAAARGAVGCPSAGYRSRGVRRIPTTRRRGSSGVLVHHRPARPAGPSRARGRGRHRRLRRDPPSRAQIAERPRHALPRSRPRGAESTLLDLTGPRAGTISPGTSPPFGGLLGSPRSWWATPIAEHGNPPRILVVGFNHHEAIHLRHVDLAAALDGEDLAPYDTTRLLDIRPESTIDGLTGLLDRNQFLAKASEQLKIARTYRRAIAAIALDTNHLKRINDSYGHAVPHR